MHRRVTPLTGPLGVPVLFCSSPISSGSLLPSTGLGGKGFRTVLLSLAMLCRVFYYADTPTLVRV